MASACRSPAGRSATRRPSGLNIPEHAYPGSTIRNSATVLIFPSLRNLYTRQSPCRDVRVAAAAGHVSHARIQVTRAAGRVSHARIQVARAAGRVSHVRIQVAQAAGRVSHVRIQVARAAGRVSHVRIQVARAAGRVSHVRIQVARAAGRVSHARLLVPVVDGRPKAHTRLAGEAFRQGGFGPEGRQNG
jgi:hypothetical protein